MLIDLDYSMGHFTRANVERFIALNSGGQWGTQKMPIRMFWGYWQPLEVNTVLISISDGSQIGYQHQTATNGTNCPVIVRKTSLPLGILPSDYASFYFRCDNYVQNIRRVDLSNYVGIAYDDQESELSERLLTVVSLWYTACRTTSGEVSHPPPPWSFSSPKEIIDRSK